MKSDQRKVVDASMVNRWWKLVPPLLLVFFALACVEVAPPPPAPALPTAESGTILTVGIESNLDALRPILAQQIGTDSLTPLFVSDTADALTQRLKDGELDAVFVYEKPADSSLWTSAIALDSLAVIAHPDVAVQQVSRSDLQQIFSGDVTNWRFAGGDDQSIAVFVLRSNSGVDELFNARVMENRPFAVSAVVPLSRQAMLDLVTETAGAIGFLPSSQITAESEIKTLPVDGFFPQFNTVRSQQYPLTIPIYIVASDEPQGELRRLAAWLQSADGQQALGDRFVQIGAGSE